MTRPRLYAVMIACFFLGGVSVEAMHHFNVVATAAVAAIACAGAMYGLTKTLE